MRPDFDINFCYRLNKNLRFEDIYTVMLLKSPTLTKIDLMEQLGKNFEEDVNCCEQTYALLQDNTRLKSEDKQKIYERVHRLSEYERKKKFFLPFMRLKEQKRSVGLLHVNLMREIAGFV